MSDSLAANRKKLVKKFVTNLTTPVIPIYEYNLGHHSHHLHLRSQNF